jgi:hypothetical protein
MSGILCKVLFNVKSIDACFAGRKGYMSKSQALHLVARFTLQSRSLR